jgi:23S rRNA pseudouridine2604 synthase
MEQIRLNKYIAMCGVCSRRDADKLIEQGKVTVNGKTAATGMTVSDDDAVKVENKLLRGQKNKVVLAFYKPVGVTCTEKDPHAEKKINDIVKYPERVTYAGRLDKESEGLLLLSNDGELINAMMRGANRHEKEYTVKTDKEITAEFIDKMSAGIYLKDLDTTTRECNVTKLGKFTFNIILTQGLNRQIRRMCEACGYRIKSLKRTRVMNITLGQLKPGQYRQLGAEELNRLYAECGLKPTTAR